MSIIKFIAIVAITMISLLSYDYLHCDFRGKIEKSLLFSFDYIFFIFVECFFLYSLFWSILVRG